MADGNEDKHAARYIKKAVLALGQLQLPLNHERWLLSYGERNETSDTFEDPESSGWVWPLSNGRSGSLLNSLVVNDFLTKMDLKDAYLTLPIHQRHQKYLHFRWRGKLYQFPVLPFSLSSLPDYSLMKVLMTFLRRQTFKSVLYFRDICLVSIRSGSSKDPGDSMASCAPRIHHTLGEVFGKSTSKRGFIVDTVNLLVILPQVKVDRIISLSTDLIECKGCALWTLASLLCKLQNASTAILPALLHYRMMQMAKTRALARVQQIYAAYLILPELTLWELLTIQRWWIQNLPTWNGKSFLKPDLDIVITSDDSLLGWVVKCLGQITQVRWFQIEMLQHSNVLVLRVAELALKSFKDLWKDSHVQLRLDNMTVVKMCSSQSQRCLVLTKETWEFVLLHGSIFQANRTPWEHIPGKQNTIVDFQSRIFKVNSNWKLCPQVS